MLARLADRYLRREVVRFVSVCCLGFAGLILVAFFAAGRRGTPRPLAELFGGDYRQFFMIGALQRDYGPGRLYDLELQDRVLHHLLPSFPAELHLPFVYPPLIALGFRPFARPPFAASYGAWLVAAAVLYAASLALAIRSCGAIGRKDRATAWLIALSFEPFAFECWIGGQLATIGCLGIAVALVCRRSGRPVVAGVALATLAYKPTLLVLILPMLVAGHEWRMLAGFAGGGLALVLANLAYAGPGPCLDFVGLMVGYARGGGSSGPAWNTHKYVDLGAALKLAGVPPVAARGLALGATLPAVGVLAVMWHRAAKAGQDARDLAWAATLCWTPVLNIYGPIYDVILVVPGLILAGGALRRHPDGWPMGFALALALVYAGALVSPAVALRAGIQPITICLIVAGVYLTRASFAAAAAGAIAAVNHPRPARTGDVLPLPPR